jgi:threonine dehydrogenase-like Zn-dependent dehydrogenase
MKAVVMQDAALKVEDLADPEPGPGEALVKTLACGICGSDLHMLHQCDDVLSGFQRGGMPLDFDASAGIVFGHEYCAEILDYGAAAQKKLKPGTRVCSIPYIISDRNFEHVGYSNHYPGGYGEKMILPEQLLIPVPGDLPSDIAALTEPLAVGAHAVARAGLAGDEVPVVIGCGPIGLAVIIALKASGAGPVVASDFSPLRRRMAEKLGADVVVDPAKHSPYQSWVEVAAPPDYDPQGGLALFGLGPQPRPCVVFECVGVPGMIQQAIAGGPPKFTRVVVVGVCMQSDVIEPIVGMGKEMNIHWAFGYTSEEFADTLHGLADGRIEAGALITSSVGPEDVADAFEALGDPESEVKVMIEFNN